MRKFLQAAMICSATLLAQSPSLAVEFIPDAKNKLTLHLSGVSYHFVPDNQNKWNYGLGLSYSLGQLGGTYEWLNGVRVAYELDVYKDSYHEIAGYTGVSFKKSYRDVFNYGIAAGVVTSKDLQNKGWPVFPAVVPFVETRFNSRLNVRMIAVPP